MQDFNSDFRISEVDRIMGRTGGIAGNIITALFRTTTLKIEGDILYGVEKPKGFFGWLSGRESEYYILLRNIDAIELIQTRQLWILLVGIATITFIIGLFLIAYYFYYKESCIVVYTQRTNVVVFYKLHQAEAVKEFASNLLKVSRALGN